jgi:hypothetical protein
MASNALRRRRLAKHQVPDESTDSDRKHDPAVIGHEEQPIRISLDFSTPFTRG